MGQHLQKILLITLIIFSYSCFAQLKPIQENSDQPADTSQQDLDSLIQVLENPTTRETFIQQLKGLAVSQSPSNTMIIKEEGALLVHGLADSLESLAHQFDEMTDDIKNIPALFSWVLHEIETPERRLFWEEVFLDMLLIIGSSYLLLYLSAWLLITPKQKIVLKNSARKSLRIGNFFILALLDLIPIALFVLTAYFLTGLVDPPRLIKLLVAAWINAIIIVYILQAIVQFISSVDFRNFTFLNISSEPPSKGNKQLTRFIYIAVYGYFVSQSTLILNTPRFIFEIFNLFLSAFVAIMLIFWVFRYRENMANIIRGNPEKIQVAWLINIRQALADIWPWIALAYITTLFLIITLEIHHGFLFIIESTALSIAILAVSFFALNGLEWLAQGIVKSQKKRLEVAPGFESQIKNHFVVIKKVLRGIIYLIVLFALFSAWNIHAFNWLWFGAGHMLSEKILRIFAIIAATFLIWVFCVSVIEYYLSLHISKEKGARAPRARSKTLLSVSRHFLAIILITMSSMLVVSELGVNIGPLVAGAGVLGLAVGFGSQRLVQDIINGIFILLDDTISVDDLIVTAGKRGTVEALSIRTLRLRDINGDSHTIPFSAVDTITNQTKNYSYAMFSIKIGHHDNVDDVLDALKRAGAKLQASPEFDAWVWEPIDISGIEAFTEHGVEIRGRIKTAPGKQGEVSAEFNRLIKLELDRLGVAWPYLQYALIKNTSANQ